MDDCDELANGLFQSKWVDAEKRYKQTLIQFMHQAQQHILFIAGGIIPITMNSNITVSDPLVYINTTFKICSTFLKVAKFAFSIITIVKQMNLAEQFK